MRNYGYVRSALASEWVATWQRTLPAHQKVPEIGATSVALNETIRNETIRYDTIRTKQNETIQGGSSLDPLYETRQT